MSATRSTGLRRSSRVTPRNSEASSEISSRTAETPYANVSRPVRGLDARELTADVDSQLRQLAVVMQKSSTPAEANDNARPFSSQANPYRTPSAGGGPTVRGRGGRPPAALKRTTPTTPHTLRALQQRRRAAALTPGRARRQSGRQQRETPRDTLRQLSKRER